MTRPTVSTPVNDALDLVLDRVVDVPRELVFRAWTQPEHLMPWFCPKPWRTTQCEIDLRPGGKFRTVMEGPNGERHDNEGCYLEVVPNERLVWTGLMTAGFRPASVPDGVPVFTCILTFSAEGKGTRYRAHVMHRDPAGRDTHEAMGFSQGWGAALDQLVALLKSAG
ncbi:MAG: SRPBCC family protein [Gemmatimonadetes bacterium]|nr:SRPBCC family protein [Gemmatimonadota bacterium]MCC7132213.1 SRPBCC family protein [Gemmatimonadales bacterium]